MSLADLTLRAWRSYDLPTARRLAREAAALVGGRVTLVESTVHLGAPLHRVRIEWNGQEFALIPGGSVSLGLDLDTWRPTPGAELTSDVTAVHGGDGGESVCGGYGRMPAWLPLATANRNPVMAEFVYGPEGEDLCEDFSTRPVLAL
ncbi:hypothetical protein [Streptomyces sp. NPDC048272]|uniref:hypothetical protein n=1 Tax=Streptomyces sp. NPDC048272 TaxID=3154616 RepID=UPI0033FF8C9A